LTRGGEHILSAFFSPTSCSGLCGKQAIILLPHVRQSLRPNHHSLTHSLGAYSHSSLTRTVTHSLSARIPVTVSWGRWGHLTSREAVVAGDGERRG
jgi:hypothetical protein